MTAPDAVPSQFLLTDLGNAERLIDRYEDEVRYVPAWKRWLIWDGTRWKQDDTCGMEQRAQITVRGMYTVLESIADRDERTRLYNHALRSESASRLQAMVTLATARPGIAIAPNALDADPWLFNVANGVVDLRTGRLLAHLPTQLLTKRSDVVYDPEATCPLWLSVLDRLFDREQPLIDYLQRAIGYTLTGLTGEQVLHLCHGTGFNGKSKFLGAIGDLLGEYAVSADFTSFLEAKHGGPREDLARLAGARMVRSIEVGEGKRLNEPLIKGLTGEDIIAARFLYSGTFEFLPTFKLWLGVNHRPVIRGTDYAIWRRIRLVPFLVTIPLDDRDPELADKLRAELPGILNWAIAGCLAWQKHGLKAPAIVQLMGDQFRAESDVLGAFLDDYCEFDASYFESSADLYHSYKEWCQETGEYCITMTLFGRKLEERGLHVSRMTAGYKRRHGLRLRVTAKRNGHGQLFGQSD